MKKGVKMEAPSKNIVFEDIIIIIAIIGIIFGLTIGIYMGNKLGEDHTFTSMPPGSFLMSAHVHMLCDAALVIMMALMFRKRQLGSVQQIKNVGFVLLLLGSYFQPIGLIGMGYNVPWLIKVLEPGEYMIIGGLIMLVATFIISKAPKYEKEV